MLTQQKNIVELWIGSSVLMAVLLVMICTGCQRFRFKPLFARNVVTEQVAPTPPTYQTFVSPRFWSNRPNRILMIESGQNNGNYEESRKLIAELATQIRASGAFEVVTPEVRLHSTPDNILHGRFDEREIAYLSRSHSADAIALVRVNDLQAHGSLRTSATVAVIDCQETVVTFGLDGAWDTANLNTKNQFEQFVSGRTMTNGPSIYYRSPSQLLAFVASQIAVEMQSAR